MRKTYSFDEVSDRVCLQPGCIKRIKKRLVEIKDARFCYEHEPKRNISGHSKRSRKKDLTLTQRYDAAIARERRR